MLPEDAGFIEWAFKGAVGMLFTIGGYLWLTLTRSVSKNRDDIAEHKLHVSENYAKKSEITKVFDAIDEVRRDIKTLLIRDSK